MLTINNYQNRIRLCFWCNEKKVKFLLENSTIIIMYTGRYIYGTVQENWFIQIKIKKTENK